MFNKIKQSLLNINLEGWYCIFFMILGTLIVTLSDMKETNNLIAFYSNIILVFVTYGISKIKDEIRNLVKDEGK